MGVQHISIHCFLFLSVFVLPKKVNAKGHDGMCVVITLLRHLEQICAVVVQRRRLDWMKCGTATADSAGARPDGEVRELRAEGGRIRGFTEHGLCAGSSPIDVGSSPRFAIAIVEFCRPAGCIGGSEGRWGLTRWCRTGEGTVSKVWAVSWELTEEMPKRPKVQRVRITSQTQ